jgi:hypothetical protein
MFTFRRSSRRVRCALVAALTAGQVLWLMDTGMLAFERVLKASVLEIHQRESIFVDPASGDQVGLAQKPTYLMRSDDRLSLRLTDPNPLLFSYNIEVTSQESADHAAAAGLAKALAAFVDPFRTLAGAGPGETSTVEGLELGGFRANLAKVQDDLDGIQSNITLSIGSAADIAAMKTEVAAWNVPKLADDVRKGYDLLARIAAKCLKGVPLEGSAGPVPCTTAMPGSAPRGKPQPAPVSTPPAPAPVRPSSAALAGQGTSPVSLSASSTYRLLTVAAQAPSNAAPPRPTTPTPAPTAPAGTSSQSPATTRPGAQARPGAPKRQTLPADRQPSLPQQQDDTGKEQPATLAASTIRDFTVLALAMQPRVDAALDILKHFAADVADVSTPKVLSCADGGPACNYSPQDRTVTFVVAPATRYEPFMAEAVKARRASMSGRYDFALKAYSPVALGFGPAFVVRFLRNPTFVAAKSGDRLVIQSTSDQAAGYNVAAMLTMTPRAWREPTFGGQFQLGVSPAKDQLGIYAGAGITVQSVFTIGGGFAWQQVNRLADGLAVGQTLDSPDALHTTTEFKPGFYIHATINLK